MIESLTNVVMRAIGVAKRDYGRVIIVWVNLIIVSGQLCLYDDNKKVHCGLYNTDKDKIERSNDVRLASLS